MFTFTPRTEEELNAMNLLEPGEGIFEILDAIQEVSQNGNNQIKLKLRVLDKNGREGIIFDYLVNIEFMEYKIRHFCECIGLMEKYNLGGFDANDCLGKSGKLKIGISKDKKGQYPDKNSIVDYLKGSESKTIQKELLKPFADDDIPF
jgi:hypothetical protein